MLIVLEQIAMQGLFFFITLGQSLYHMFTKKEIVPAEKTETPLWGYYLLSKETYIEESIDYAPSEITMEQEQFFQSFIDTMAIPLQEDCSNDIPLESIESDMLTMDAWDEQPAPVEVSRRLSARADSRIADNKMGEQLWVVEVFGEEQGYLHVSDGSARAWVDAVAFGNFNRGDILSILIERNDQNHVLAKDIDILQKKSFDFATEEQISDNLELFEEYSTFAS